MRSTLVRFVAGAAAAAVVALGVWVPAGAANPGSIYTGRVDGQRVALWGDSISDAADANLDAQFQASRRFYSVTVDATRVPYHFADVDRVVAVDAPDVAIVQLGSNDANAGLTAQDFRNRIRSMLQRLAGVPCVFWVNVKSSGVNPYYTRLVTNGRVFNTALRDVLSLGSFPNTRILRYAAWANENPDAFLPDGLHLNRPGAARYADWLERSTVCP